MTTPTNPQSAGQPDPFAFSDAQSAPPPPATEAPLVAKPKSVEIAFLIFAISGVVGIVLDLVYIFTGSFSSSQIINIVVNVGVIALAYTMRNGQNWARITLTVLAGLTLVLGLLSLSAASLIIAFLGTLGTLLVLLVIVQLIAMAAGIFFLFRPESNRYFDSR